MKTRQEIETRLRVLLEAEMGRRLADAQRRHPRLCTHNILHSLDSRKLVNGEPNPDYNRITRRGLPIAQTIGLCGIGSENLLTWEMNICDEEIDARRCPVFNPVMSKDKILPQLQKDLADPKWVIQNLPEVSTLMWVMGVETVSLPNPSWWARVKALVKQAVSRDRMVPPEPPFDALKLLNPPE